VTLHLARVFLTGAYRNGAGREQHRQWNWAIGVSLLVGTLLLSFTGYLLPWDQLAYWAVTTSMSIVASVPIAGTPARALLLGGDEVGQPALMRFYVLHIVVLPVIAAILFAYHMWRVRKDGGLAHPAEGTSDDVPVVSAIPAVVVRVALVAVATWLAVTVLAVLVPAPLEDAANPLLTPNPAKAPWYFLWLQEIVADTTVRLGPMTVNGALVGGVVLPAVLAAGLTLWPWLDRSPASVAGAWVPAERRTQAVVFFLVAALVVGLTVVGLLRGPSWHFFWPWQSWPDLPTRF